MAWAFFVVPGRELKSIFPLKLPNGMHFIKYEFNESRERENCDGRKEISPMHISKLNKFIATLEIDRQVIGRIIMASVATLNYTANYICSHALYTHQRTHTHTHPFAVAAVDRFG